MPNAKQGKFLNQSMEEFAIFDSRVTDLHFSIPREWYPLFVNKNIMKLILIIPQNTPYYIVYVMFIIHEKPRTCQI